MSKRGSLIVTTFEMPRHLSLVLSGLLRQSTDDFEVLLCDDGSGEETARVVKEYTAKFKVPFKHFWQEHAGFRKCRILNEAVRNSQGEILIFLDGDCVPHRDYIRDHLENQEKGRYLAGRRVEVGEQLANRLTAKQVRSGFFDRPRIPLILSALRGETEHLQRSMRVPWPKLRRAFKMDRVDDLKGCNYSVAKSHLEAINGFDESYEGYGREDTDVELRLQNLGLKIKSIKGLALQFHLWHPRREFTPANDDRLNEVKRTGRVKCKQGLVSL